MEIVLSSLCVAILLVFVIFLMNRSRLTLEQLQHAGCSESELKELVKEVQLPYRRKYGVFGPFSVDRSELAQARIAYPQIKKIREETNESIRKMTEDAAAKMTEANRLHQEQMRRMQEEAEHMQRVYDEILKKLRSKYITVPPPVVHALYLLDLPQDAPLVAIQQRYRLLAKRSHPDTGGSHEQFIQVKNAYDCIMAWIVEQE